MTKSTITREQLEEWVAQFDEDGGCDATDRQLEALIRQSLAAMDREPVAVIDKEGNPMTRDECNDDRIFAICCKVGTPLYTHPAPSIPSAVTWCPKCNDTGLADSGGVQPWGEPILIECDCRAEPAPVAQCVPLGDSPYDVPHSMPSTLRELIAEEIGILFSDDDAQSVWDVCRRAAMLAAAPQEVKSE
ncbi:hypothetical protein ACXEHT_005532 [Klebsiella variicola]